MAVRVMIKRTIPKNQLNEAMKYLMKLRVMASQEPGYVSGETLINADNSDTILVISTWQTEDDWKSWAWSQERYEIQRKVDAIIGENTTTYEVYHYPEKKRISVV